MLGANEPRGERIRHPKTETAEGIRAAKRWACLDAFVRFPAGCRSRAHPIQRPGAAVPPGCGRRGLRTSVPVVHVPRLDLCRVGSASVISITTRIPNASAYRFSVRMATSGDSIRCVSDREPALQDLRSKPKLTPVAGNLLGDVVQDSVHVCQRRIERVGIQGLGNGGDPHCPHVVARSKREPSGRFAAGGCGRNRRRRT